MYRRRFHKPGTAPATLIPPPAAAAEVHITLIQYDANEIIEHEVARIEDVFGCRDEGKVSWINVDGLGNIDLLRKLGGHFGLHPLALEDVLNTQQRPKMDYYDDHFFIVAQMVTLADECEVSFEQVSLFLGRSFLITLQEEAGDAFEAVRARLRKGGGFARTRGHDYLAYALLDAIIDHYFPVLEDLGEAVEQLEDQLVEQPTRETIAHVHDLKRILLQLRRSAWPEREVLSTLARDDSGLVKHETQLFLRDCYDHTIQIMDVIESYRDLTAGMMDLYLSSVSNRTNEVMRLLTVISSIFIPLTFIAGVYGMNFDTSASHWNMPELHEAYGYPVCIGLMILLAVSLLIVFRKKGWL